MSILQQLAVAIRSALGSGGKSDEIKNACAEMISHYAHAVEDPTTTPRQPARETTSETSWMRAPTKRVTIGMDTNGRFRQELGTMAAGSVWHFQYAQDIQFTFGPYDFNTRFRFIEPPDRPGLFIRFEDLG